MLFRSGIDTNFERAYAKALIAAGTNLPASGTVFMSLADKDKPALVSLAKGLRQLGFSIVATEGNHRILQEGGVESTQILKLHEGRPNGKDMIQNGEINVMFVTPSGDEVDARDGLELRRTALGYKVPLITTTAAMKAVVNALRGMKAGPLRVQSLQQVLGLNKVEVESR